MAKPKFELTTDLVKVEPEPHFQKQPESVQSHTPEIAISSSNEDAKLTEKPERQSISLYISKDLKKSFHLHCIQNGMSMTDAMEEAIKRYLET